MNKLLVFLLCLPLFGIDPEESKFLSLLNNYRVQNGRQSLASNQNLKNAARWMSYDLARSPSPSHTDSLNRGSAARMLAFGYQSSTNGENILGGSSSAEDAFNRWKESPGHNANMLNIFWTNVGIGLATVPGSPFVSYWVTDFGGPTFSLPINPPIPTPPVIVPPIPPVVPPVVTPPPVVPPVITPPVPVPPNATTGIDIYNANFEAGMYLFTINTPYGLRVWIDNEILIERWRDLPQLTFKVSRYISAGRHTIRVEHYQLNPLLPINITWSKN